MHIDSTGSKAPYDVTLRGRIWCDTCTATSKILC